MIDRGVIMGEQANTTLIESLYAAFNRGDIQTILTNSAPNAEWINFGPGAVPYCGDFSGRITDFFQAIGQSTTDGKVVMNRAIESGDIVVTEGRYTATVRSTGAKIDTPIAHIFTLRGGKVVSWRGYADSAAVLAAHTGKAASA